jgi:hypothetical protein
LSFYDGDLVFGGVEGWVARQEVCGGAADDATSYPLGQSGPWGGEAWQLEG